MNDLPLGFRVNKRMGKLGRSLELGVGGIDTPLNVRADYLYDIFAIKHTLVSLRETRHL